ncbi:MAG TPA: AAA family ATPase [Pyrinomonadaceae bacterium]|nr:AAA family ATPase [Pyrinomonadaceae bacterium]
MTHTAQIIPEKVTPPFEPPPVTRERLLRTLGESLDTCNSTIIHGRAGTGKTMLAADFARQCSRAVAWYKLDAPDCELSVFFQYLCASIAEQRPGFGQRVLERVGEQPVAAGDVPLLVECFVYELLESNEPLLVVIDDLHLVYDAEWMVPFFRRLLPLLPREVHFCLIGRSLPPTPLWRMRSKQTLCVVDESALAFTLAEARTLFTRYGLPAERADAALLQTRGRAATLDAHAAAAADAAGRPLTPRSRAGHTERPLRLVKGFRKSSMGTA